MPFLKLSEGQRCSKVERHKLCTCNTFQFHPTLLLPGPYPKRNSKDQSSQHISSNQKRKAHIGRSLYVLLMAEPRISYPIGLCCVENLQSRYCNSLYASLLSTCLPMQGCLIKGASAMFCSIELSLCISSLSLPSYLS